AQYRSNLNPSTNSHRFDLRQESASAIRQIGASNAVPHLLKMLSYEEPWWRTTTVMRAFGKFRPKPAWLMHREAIDAFEVLGPDARCCVSAFTHIRAPR